MLTRRRTVALALLLVTLSWLAVPRPAGAHDELVESSPAAGSTLPTVPSEITLTFSGPPMDLGATVLVVDAEGVDHATGRPVFASRTATVPVGDLAPDAFYQVRWRVVSADGHVLSGVVNFGVGDISQAEPMPEPVSARTRPAAASTSGAGGDDGGSVDRTVAVALTGALAALLITGGGWWLRSSRSNAPSQSSTPHTSSKEN